MTDSANQKAAKVCLADLLDALDTARGGVDHEGYPPAKYVYVQDVERAKNALRRFICERGREVLEAMA